MDIVNTINKNIFGENNKHASDSIDFSLKPTPVHPSQKIFGVNLNKPQEQKPTNNLPNNMSLGTLTKEKPK